MLVQLDFAVFDPEIDVLGVVVEARVPFTAMPPALELAAATTVAVVSSFPKLEHPQRTAEACNGHGKLSLRVIIIFAAAYVPISNVRPANAVEQGHKKTACTFAAWEATPFSCAEQEL